jgi:hypothetical protein
VEKRPTEKKNRRSQALFEFEFVQLGQQLRLFGQLLQLILLQALALCLNTPGRTINLTAKRSSLDPARIYSGTGSDFSIKYGSGFRLDLCLRK